MLFLFDANLNGKVYVMYLNIVLGNNYLLFVIGQTVFSRSGLLPAIYEQ